MAAVSCYTEWATVKIHHLGDCQAINVTTCLPLADKEEEGVGDVEYDEDGCYAPDQYMAAVNSGDVFQDYSFFIGLLMFVFGILGICGNSLSIFVLLKKEKICFNYLLVALNCFDSFHIVFAILDVMRNNHQELYPDYLLGIFPYFHYPLYRLSLCCSIFIVVSVSVERFLAVTKPHHRLQQQQHRSLYYILPCVLLAIVINIPKFFETETVEYCIDFSHCGCGRTTEKIVRPTSLRLSRNYILFYSTWTWVSLTSLLPFIVLSFLNFAIWRRLNFLKEVTRKVASPSTNGGQESKSSLSSSMILICTVSMFLLCHLPRLLLSCYEGAMISSILHCQAKNKGITPIWYLYAMASVQLLQVVNTSLNFPIYWMVGNFRETCLGLLPCSRFSSRIPQRQPDHCQGDGGQHQFQSQPSNHVNVRLSQISTSRLS